MLGVDKGAYPNNFDYSYAGLTTIRNAIKRSVNVVAAKVWQDILGPDLSLEYLDKVNLNRTMKDTCRWLWVDLTKV